MVDLACLAFRLLPITSRLADSSTSALPTIHFAHRRLQLLHALPTFDLRFLEVAGPGPPRSRSSMTLPWR